MKKTLHSALLLLAFTLTSFAQEYHPLLNTTSWYISVADMGGASSYWVEPDGTETIGDYTYVKYPAGGTNYTYVREDINEKKVYRYVNGADELIYDFSVEVDDVITFPDNGWGNNSFTVIEKSTINTLDGERIKFILRPLNENYGDEYWIEGVGNIYFDPLTPINERATDPMFTVTCHYNNAVNIYSNTGTDCPTPPFLETASFTTPVVTLYPNPFSTQATIATQGYFSNAALEVYNTLGQKVLQLNNLNGNEVQLQKGNLAPGMYYATLTQNGKTLLNEKIIIAE